MARLKRSHIYACVCGQELCVCTCVRVCLCVRVDMDEMRRGAVVYSAANLSPQRLKRECLTGSPVQRLVSNAAGCGLLLSLLVLAALLCCNPTAVTPGSPSHRPITLQGTVHTELQDVFILIYLYFGREVILRLAPLLKMSPA